jgi:hypothetical protein
MKSLITLLFSFSLTFIVHALFTKYEKIKVYPVEWTFKQSYYGKRYIKSLFIISHYFKHVDIIRHHLTSLDIT